MDEILDGKFHEWTDGKDIVEARIDIFERIRDIPYAIIPRLSNSECFADILRTGRGSCTPKHLLLARMYELLGLTVVLAVFPFSWADIEVDWPASISEIVKDLNDDHHMACRVEIEGRLVLVDATVDLRLASLGLPMNKNWDGVSDTLLAIEPSGPEQLFHPSEADQINSVMIDNTHIQFFDQLNCWLDEIRMNQ